MKLATILRYAAVPTVALVTYVVFARSAAHGYLVPSRATSTLPKGLEEAELAGAPCWVSPGWKDHDTVFLMIHGYGGGRSQWTILGPSLAAKGFGVVAPAMPGHDASPDLSVGFGEKEAALVVRLAQELAPRKVVVVGVSLGGAASWQAAGSRPELFHAVATEGAYPTFKEAMDRFLARLPGPPFLKSPIIAFARWESGIDPDAQRPIDGATAWAKTGKPAIVAHGSADELFPREYGERLAQAANCPFWLVPDARHAYVDETDHDGWVSRLISLTE